LTSLIKKWAKTKLIIFLEKVGENPEPKAGTESGMHHSGSGFKTTSVADPDPGSGAFLTPGSGSGIRNRFFSGSRIPTPYFLELSDKFLGKKFFTSLTTKGYYLRLASAL
jgi:hypothetical protein